MISRCIEKVLTRISQALGIAKGREGVFRGAMYHVYNRVAHGEPNHEDDGEGHNRASPNLLPSFFDTYWRKMTLMRRICLFLIVASLPLSAVAQGRYWIPVAAHVRGVGGSVWRTDVAILNPHAGPASAEVRLRNGGEIWTMTVVIPAGAAHALEDVVDQLVGGNGQGSIEVISDLGVTVTSRTYNVASTGTFGQSLDGLSPGVGLEPGRRAVVGPLQENVSFRTNIGVLNMGQVPLTTRIELYDSAGTLVGFYDLAVPPGEVRQDGRPYSARFARSDIAGGYAIVTLESGALAWAYASVIDAGTGDPTTVAMRSPQYTPDEVVGDYDGTLTFLENTCEPELDGQILDFRVRVSADEGLLYNQSCYRLPGGDWQCDDGTELLGKLEGDLISHVWHENNVWFEPCLHVDHGSHRFVVSDGMVRGTGIVTEWWDVDDPQACNDLGDENFPCTERVEIEAQVCVGCWPGD